MGSLSKRGFLFCCQIKMTTRGHWVSNWSLGYLMVRTVGLMLTQLFIPQWAQFWANFIFPNPNPDPIPSVKLKLKVNLDLTSNQVWFFWSQVKPNMAWLGEASQAKLDLACPVQPRGGAANNYCPHAIHAYIHISEVIGFLGIISEHAAGKSPLVFPRRHFGVPFLVAKGVNLGRLDCKHPCIPVLSPAVFAPQTATQLARGKLVLETIRKMAGKWQGNCGQLYPKLAKVDSWNNLHFEVRFLLRQLLRVSILFKWAGGHYWNQQVPKSTKPGFKIL